MCTPMREVEETAQPDHGSIEIQNKTVSMVGEEFLSRQKYVKKFKGGPSLHDFTQNESTDPKVSHFLECQTSGNLALPILEKVQNKTLVLQDYTLSDGNCRGLALAC